MTSTSLLRRVKLKVKRQLGRLVSPSRVHRLPSQISKTKEHYRSSKPHTSHHQHLFWQCSRLRTSRLGVVTICSPAIIQNGAPLTSFRMLCRFHAHRCSSQADGDDTVAPLSCMPPQASKRAYRELEISCMCPFSSRTAHTYIVIALCRALQDTGLALVSPVSARVGHDWSAA